MLRSFTRDGWSFLLLAIAIGIGLGGTYGSDYEHPVLGMVIGVPVCLVASELLQRLFVDRPTRESTSPGKSP